MKSQPLNNHPNNHLLQCNILDYYREANVKTLQFRKRRGQKMHYLINKKKDDEDDDDDFWKNNAYFGDAENEDD